VVDAATQAPIVGGTVLVALETNNGSTDTIAMQTAADSAGNFTFCPLPTGAAFDVVVVAINGAGVGYDATVAFGVPGGTALGMIPLHAEAASMAGSMAPAKLQGVVTATAGMAGATVDVSLSALQTVSAGGTMRDVTIPPQGNSTPNLSVESNANCPAMAPPNSNCASYTLIVPAGNPSAGVFMNGAISYASPASGAVPYSVGASAFVPMSGGAPDCSPSSPVVITQDSSGNPLQVTPGMTVTPKEIDFSGCS
jgi:hypothetical protein